MAGLQEIKILIVDDNAQMRTLIRSALRGAGVLDIMEAGGAAEGLEILARQSIDLVLLDLAMKPLDGLEFAARVRRSERSPNPYVALIMMTCHSQFTHVAAARDAGVNSFLAKPISGRSLIEHVLAVASDSRPFVRTPSFFGPDRRRLSLHDYDGPRRRAADHGGEGFDIDDETPGYRAAG